MSVPRTVTVSCPGKILIAGGYLVLERPNIGVTIAGTSRFFCSIALSSSPEEPENSLAGDEDGSTLRRIRVDSPQFDEQYRYVYDLPSDAVTLQPGSLANKFVQKCLQMALSFILAAMDKEKWQDMVAKWGRRHLIIDLRADNDFYSQIPRLQAAGMPLTRASLKSIPRFVGCPRDEAGRVAVAKTGLGSSAALTTSLVAALLQWSGLIVLEDEGRQEGDRRVVHNLSQLAHANAQGKIGSGFDVASAVYGSVIYRRFSPGHFHEFLQDAPLSAGQVLDAALADSSEWNQDIVPFSFPPGVSIILGDVCGGASSPSMAKAVLAWREENLAESGALWQKLAATNQLIFEQLSRLSQLHAENPALYIAAMKRLAAVSAGDWLSASTDEIGRVLSEVRQHFQEARKLLKSMGIQAGVEIEPEEQTVLADATQTIYGVLAAGVPGAGGNDALFALVLSDEARIAVEELWSSWNQTVGKVSVCPLLLSSSSERPGLRHEDDMA